MEILLGVNAAVFILFFVLWSKIGYLNMLVKILFLFLGLANGIAFAIMTGFIVKTAAN